jgi:hypothetical protein
VPARVEILPYGEIARILCPCSSTMKRVPTESCHNPVGPWIVADVAVSPSPEEEYDPSPTIICI